MTLLYRTSSPDNIDGTLTFKYDILYHDNQHAKTLPTNTLKTHKDRQIPGTVTTLRNALANITNDISHVCHSADTVLTSPKRSAAITALSLTTSNSSV